MLDGGVAYVIFDRHIALTGRLFTEQSRARFEGEVVPCPFRHHPYPVPETDEEENVDDTPEGPGQGAGCVDGADLSDSLGSADRSQHATVGIGK